MEVLIGFGVLIGGLALLASKDARNKKKMLEKMTPAERDEYLRDQNRRNGGEAAKRHRWNHQPRIAAIDKK